MNYTFLVRDEGREQTKLFNVDRDTIDEAKDYFISVGFPVFDKMDYSFDDVEALLDEADISIKIINEIPTL